MVGLVVMGLIGRQIGTGGVDIGSISSWLRSQKEQVGQALPNGMGELLDRTGLGGGLESTAAQARRATTAATGQFTQYTSPPRERADRDATFGIPNWAYWALPLLALGGLLWYLLGRPPEHERVAQEPAPAAQGQSVTDGVGDITNTI